MSGVTQAKLKRLLYYDPETGIFTWAVKRQGIRKGDVAGCVKYYPRGEIYYLTIKIDHKCYYAHRLAWLYVYGSWPKYQIDHKDQDGLSNRIDNLRIATHKVNQKNCKIPKNNTSGVIGVFWHKVAQKWSARIGVNSKSIYLGVFTKKGDAITARKVAEKKFGFHENHGKTLTESEL